MIEPSHVPPRTDDRSRLAGGAWSRPASPLRGRDDLVARLSASLTAAARGAGTLTVLRGTPGIGKTALLAGLLDSATRRGFRTMVVAPDVDSATTPLDALLDAALTASVPFVGRADIAPLQEHDHPQYWTRHLLSDALERAAAEHPVVVVVDDLQWLDAGSLAVLNMLVDALQDMPVSWVVATRGASERLGHRRLVDRAEAAGSLVDVLPLTSEAVAEITRDLLGHDAGPRLARELERADNVPLLVVELLRGLQEERLVETHGDVVDARDAAVPARFGASARERVALLSEPARQLVQIGSLLGREFRLVTVLDLMGGSALEIAPVLEELLTHDVLTDDGEMLAFRHDTLRESAEATIPPSLRRVLSREVVRRRLQAGETPAALARTVSTLAEPGDQESIDLLATAARDLAATDETEAARLAVQVAELSGDDPRLTPQVARLLPTIWYGGRPEEMRAIGLRLASTLAPEDTALLYLTMARLQVEADFHEAVRTCDLGLGLPGVSRATQASLLAVRALASANEADPVELHATLARARATADPEADGLALATVDACESVLVFNRGDLAAALALQESATDRLRDAGQDPSRWMPEGLWMAFMRNSLGQCDTSLALVDAGLQAALTARNVIAEAYWMMVRARALLDRGRLEEARIQSESVLDLGGELGLGDFANATAGIALFRIAVHTGDRAALERARPIVEALADGPAVTRAGRWALAVGAVDDDRLGDAFALTSTARASLGEPLPPMTTPVDYADDLDLAVLCLRAGSPDDARRVRDVAAERAARNPEVPLVTAVAHAVAGVVDDSEGPLLDAAQTLRGAERPLVLARVLEVLADVTPDHDRGVAALTEALGLYEDAGATRCVSRVLRALRDRGVRRRPRARAGENTLSLREQQVVERLAQGSTTQQVADNLLLSPHTVVTHIRHAYAKLGVSSRQELIAAVRAGEEVVGAP